jgi:hypothetical protein
MTKARDLADNAEGTKTKAVDAKGDLMVGTAADTAARLAVGTDTYLLTADNSEVTGLKWAAPAAGGMTLLSTTTLTGSSVTIASINQSYINLYVQITGATVSTGSGNLTLKINAVTNSFWAAGVDTDGSTGNTFDTHTQYQNQ